jgi:hypothetical protein
LKPLWLVPVAPEVRFSNLAVAVAVASCTTPHTLLPQAPASRSQSVKVLPAFTTFKLAELQAEAQPLVM